MAADWGAAVEVGWEEAAAGLWRRAGRGAGQQLWWRTGWRLRRWAGRRVWGWQRRSAVTGHCVLERTAAGAQLLRGEPGGAGAGDAQRQTAVSREELGFVQP